MADCLALMTRERTTKVSSSAETAAHETAAESEGTHIILMQDLKYFVDIVQRVHSGGTSFFGLRKRKYSRNQLTRSRFTGQSKVI